MQCWCRSNLVRALGRESRCNTDAGPVPLCDKGFFFFLPESTPWRQSLYGGCTAPNHPHTHKPCAVIMIIMYIYCALINAVSSHIIHINLNMIFYTHVEHSRIKFFYIKYYTETRTHTQLRASLPGGRNSSVVRASAGNGRCKIKLMFCLDEKFEMGNVCHFLLL